LVHKKSIFFGVLFFISVASFSASLLTMVEGIPFYDAIYSTFLMFLTVDILFKPETPFGKLIAVISIYLGMGAVLYTATAFASMVIETQTNLLIKGLKGGIIRMKKEKNHIIVCGYGMIGKYTLENLKKDTKKYIIIEKDPDVVQRLLDKGEQVIQGNAMDPHILEKANIKQAKVLVSTLRENSDNIYVVMTASELNPNLIIAAKASDEESVGRLHKVGAQIVVMPEVVGGKQLANAILEIDKTTDLSTISSKHLSR